MGKEMEKLGNKMGNENISKYIKVIEIYNPF